MALLHEWAYSSAQDPRNVIVFAIVFVFSLSFEAATRKTYLLLSPHQGTFDPAIKLKLSERLPNTPEISNNAKVFIYNTNSRVIKPACCIFSLTYLWMEVSSGKLKRKHGMDDNVVIVLTLFPFFADSCLVNIPFLDVSNLLYQSWQIFINSCLCL